MLKNMIQRDLHKITFYNKTSLEIKFKIHKNNKMEETLFRIRKKQS